MFLLPALSLLHVATLDPGELARRGALGVPFSAPTPAVAEKYKLSAGTGLVALSPLPNLTGDRAGIKAGEPSG